MKRNAYSSCITTVLPAPAASTPTCLRGFISGILVMLAWLSGWAQAPAPAALLVPAQPAFQAGTVATFRGRNFAPGETVVFQVTHVRGTPTVGTNHTPAQVVADPSGAFTATWLVCSNDCVGELLQLQASGQTSGRSARAVLLDLPAPPPRPATWVRTDKTDYAPGTTANITGGGFQAGETVVLQVQHADGTPDSGADHAPWSVVASAVGGCQSTWQVCTDDCLHSTLKLTARGQSSGKTAQAIFTDAGGAPTYQQLKSFGTPSPGGDPIAGLIQGTGGALYGAASEGGTSGYGTLFKLNPDGTGFTVLKNFDYSTTGGNPQARLVQATDGALYGAANTGGSSGYGTLFRLNPDGTGFTVLLNFDYFTTGAYPNGLMQGADGALYGTANSGGSGYYGTVFKLNPDGTGFTILRNFDGSTTGGYLNAGLIQGADGALYGTSTGGGSSGWGTVFKLNPDGTGFTVLKNLDPSTTGGNPTGALIQGADGALYGTASYGGVATFAGTVFKLNTDGSGFTVLQNLDYYTTGASPYAGLIQGPDGALYGTAYLGGSGGYGTVFKLMTDGSGFTVLKNFDWDTTGGDLEGGLVRGMGGTLYGTARFGGSSGYGTVFKLNADGSGFSVLKNLSIYNDISEDGGYPTPGLIQGTDGALYGTAGGGSDSGIVFKLNPDGTGFTILKNLNYWTTGVVPKAALMQGADGALYGTTSGGGSSSDSWYGTVLKLNPDGTGSTILQNFDYFTTGGYSYAALIQGADGALYGTTTVGGSGGYGTVFKLNPDGTGFTVLLNFDFSTTGGYPYAGLMQGTDGALYGTASTGGSSYGGTVFKLNPDGTGSTVLHNFGYDYFSDGLSPLAGLIQGADGALYGTAYYGGDRGGGVVFRLNPDGTAFTVLQNFDLNSTTGGYPQTGLVQGADGALYGTTFAAGSGGWGTVFKLNADGTGFTVLLNFDNSTTGSIPSGLMQGTDGNLYGTTFLGGGANAGTLFRLVFPATTPPNTPPVAKCRNVTVLAGAGCSATASIDDGSFDPDTGDTITLTQTPPGPYPLGDTLVTLTVTDSHGASSTCTSTVTVKDTTPPSITCPANTMVGCSLDRLAVVTFPAPIASDTCDPHPTVTCTPASGSASFPVGITTVLCTAVDASGNTNTCSFTVTRAPLGFTGFLSPIGGEVALGTGGSFGAPLRAFKLGSTIPIKFSANCGGTPVSTGVHTLQATKYSSAVDSDPAIDATPTDAATTGNQFQLTDASTGEWHFNLNTKPLSVGTWKLAATLSDRSIHEVWITIK